MRSLLLRSSLACLSLLLGTWLVLPAPASVSADESPAPGPAAPAESAGARQIKLTGRLERVAGQRVLTLWGTPRERGFAQGYLLAEQIVAGVEHDFERVMKPFLPKYELLVKKVVIPKFVFSEAEAAEMEGLFAGVQARLPKEKLRIAALNRDIDLVDVKALNTFGDWYGLGCSSLAVWGSLSADGQPLVGRNFDFPAFDLVLRHQYVVVRAPDGEKHGYVGVSYPGCVGILTGLSSAGVFTAIHDVPVRPTMDKALRPNVPRLMAVRRILEQGQPEGTCKQIHELVRSWPTLYGNNLMVVGPPQQDGSTCAAVLEYDCRTDMDGGCTLRMDDGEAVSEEEREAFPIQCLACTNHHRCRTPPELYFELYKRWRYPRLAAVGAAERPAKPLTVEDMFAWMGRTAFPKVGEVQGRAEALLGKQAHHGTLHQAVGQTGSGLLHVRLGEVGKNIRDVPARSYDVAALLEALRAGEAAAPLSKEPAGVR